MAKPPPSTVDNVVSLAKRRGFVYPCGEIYGGTRSAWDYGPLGVELKENIKRQWWKSMVTMRDDMVGLDSSIILPRQVWEASGHVETFTDPLTECQSCHKRFRADHLQEEVAEKKNIELTCQVEEAIPLLRQDPGKIKQILYNLLSNAIKFTPESGRVILRALTEGRFAVLQVEDTGIGIPEEDRDIIFEKFRQLSLAGHSDGVLTREHQGTGLGLSIVKELTKLLGGDVILESQPGIGSKFTIRIPLQLTGNRRYEVAVSDERIDLSKARRVETRPKPEPLANPNPSSSPSPHLGTARESSLLRALSRGEPRG